MIGDYEYQVGGSLKVNAPSYVVREADVELFEALRSRQLCCIFNSHQMGKSSLRVRVRHQLQQIGIVCASLDMTRISNEHITPQQWYRGIAFELIHELHLNNQIDLKQWWTEHNDFSPLYRLNLLIETILTAYLPQMSVCIFIDEIDSVLTLPFSAYDFFALIQCCYARRTECPIYNGLTWALFGVTDLSHMIAINPTRENSLDPIFTFFNFGKSIKLKGFQEHEAQPLMTGLFNWVSNPQAVLRTILAWTGGQPFLTQKVCQLVVQTSQASVNQQFFPPGTEVLWVEQLVRSHIIENWESQDQPEHLRTIRNYLLHNKQQAKQLLELYQQILCFQDPTADSNPASINLVLSGLVEPQEGVLRVKNSIYREVFNATWVEKQLNKLRAEC